MPKKRSRSPPPELSTNAIERMLKAEDTPDQFLLKLHNVRGAAATVSDCSHSQEVILLTQPAAMTMGTCFILIQGYVTSTCNFNGSHFLALTSFSFVSKAPAQRRLLPKYRFKSDRKVQGGLFGNFLSSEAHFLTNQDLLGGFPEEPIDKITEFLSHYDARITLNSAQNSPNSSTSPSTSTDDYFLDAIEQFRTSQQDRQNVTLSSNAGRENAAGCQQTFSNYQAALKDALSFRGHLTVSKLQEWHQTICSGLHDEAGQIRTKNVRVKVTKCAPFNQLNNVLKCLLLGFHELETRTSDRQYFVLFASAVLFGVLDIHPFSDGNGRLARLCCNWAMAKAGFPFPVHLFASPSQRKEYSRAIEQTRCNLSLVKKGNVTDAAFQEARKQAGFLRPLVELLADRLTKTIAEFGKLCDEMSTKASEEAELQAAKRFRQRQANGTCLICFEEKPNIATLCCGKAVHLNCMAQWLSSKSSCPQCRGELPQLPTQEPQRDLSEAEQARQAILTLQEHLHNIVNDFGVGDDDEYEETDSLGLEDTETTEFDDDDEDDEEGEEDTTEEDGDDTAEVAAQSEENNSTTEETEEDQEEETTTVSHVGAANQTMFCQFGNCRNRPAIDCTNGGCGRCCTLYGSMLCDRHGVYGGGITY